MEKLLSDSDKRRKRDSKRFASADSGLCQLCHAHGPDMRSLFISCFYQLQEIDEEFMDLYNEGCRIAFPDDKPGEGAAPYFMRICKSCRAAFLQRIAAWTVERKQRRSLNLDSDGDEEDDTGGVYVREFGASVKVDGPEQ